MICLNCNKEFDEPKIIQTTYEHHYGIEGNQHTYLRLEVCPYCGGEDIEEREDEE